MPNARSAAKSAAAVFFMLFSPVTNGSILRSVVLAHEDDVGWHGAVDAKGGARGRRVVVGGLRVGVRIGRVVPAPAQPGVAGGGRGGGRAADGRTVGSG